ncbi:MAG: nicotinamide-nucleotide amidohydrolase family protein [Planctomycetaceae bacterium]|nr:nicotinamide-nucleotide amidohydrolase family protein [Planctomycetaceae bacterium]
MNDPAFAAALDLATGLREKALKIVFAESCTAGLASATLARIPGISDHHCGSAVVYRLDTKHHWIDVPEAWLINPGPVSREVAEAMATGVLQKTPEADIAAAITGHLGPNAPAGMDGLIWMAVAVRKTAAVTTRSVVLSTEAKHTMTLRESRQHEATTALLHFAAENVSK